MVALDYTRTQATSRVIYLLHLTGVARAAEQIGDKAYRRVRARQQEKQEEEAEPQSEETDEAGPPDQQTEETERQ
jgi:hypothetical protein